MKLYFLAFIFNICLVANATNFVFSSADSNWADPARCAQCHEDAHASWKGSDHDKANRLVSAKEDDKAFVPAHKMIYGNSTLTFTKKDDKFVMQELNGNEKKTYTFDGVIGVKPLYQYLSNFGKGRYQVTSMAYEPSSNEWFDVFENEVRYPWEWGHWKSQGMNWNSNCAYCHTTHFEKNLNPNDMSYDSKWLIMGVTCVQCHKDMKQHDKDARRAKKEQDIVFKENITPSQWTNLCATCHSRREEISANTFVPGDLYLDHFRPSFPDMPNVYYPDGQILDEDFVYSSFIMSRQHLKDVNCVDCHDIHSLGTKLPIENNELCMLCHADGINGALKIDPTAHSFHKEGSDGNRCVECHMPKTVYMARDPRRDHGFISPDPISTKLNGTPNSCMKCHDKEGEGLDWVIDAYNKWYDGASERFKRIRARTQAVYQTYQGNNSQELAMQLYSLIKTEDNGAWRSILTTLVSTWINNPNVYGLTVELLKDKDPLVRSAAVHSLSQRGDTQIVLEPLLNDPVRLVRVDAAFALRYSIDKNSKAYKELEEYLEFNLDRPLGSLRAAEVAFAQNDTKKGLSLSEKALVFEDKNSELFRQVAIMQTRGGDYEEAEALLKKAIENSPKDATFTYSLALFYSETNELNEAIKYFEKSVALDPYFVRALYNLALAYSKTNQHDKAIVAIDKVIALAPDVPSFLYAKGTIFYAAGKKQEGRQLMLQAQMM